jgi:hypothetical protein
MIKSFHGEHRWLSNFAPARIVDQHCIVYPTAEHAYQAAKTTDVRIRQEIAALATPGQAKRFGKSVVLRLNWQTQKIHFMGLILQQKFRNPQYGALLRGTGDCMLVEGNTWHDNFWGDCDCGACSLRPGLNHLGLLLMGVRSELGGSNA